MTGEVLESSRKGKSNKRKRGISENKNDNNKSKKLLNIAQNPPILQMVKKPSVIEDEDEPSGIPVNIAELTPAEAQSFPLLHDVELIKKFQAVPCSNNQKGRLRQLIRGKLITESSSDAACSNPFIISQKIYSILNSSSSLDDSTLRKIRILHNMLVSATQKGFSSTEKKKKRKKKNKKNKEKKEVIDNSQVTNEVKQDGSRDTESVEDVFKDCSNSDKLKSETLNGGSEEEEDLKESIKEEVEIDGEDAKIAKDDCLEINTKENKEQPVIKVKGPKRYVVFLGNLPYDVDKETILEHFREIKDGIKDVRLPKKQDNSPKGIAYVELKNESTYQLALSKHHTMLNNRRINVLYTQTGKKKVDMKFVKIKSAKLSALCKAGKILGSVPENKRRSFRRKKVRERKMKEDQGD